MIPAIRQQLSHAASHGKHSSAYWHQVSKGCTRVTLLSNGLNAGTYQIPVSKVRKFQLQTPAGVILIRGFTVSKKTIAHLEVPESISLEQYDHLLEQNKETLCSLGFKPNTLPMSLSAVIDRVEALKWFPLKTNRLPWVYASQTSGNPNPPICIKVSDSEDLINAIGKIKKHINPLLFENVPLWTVSEITSLALLMHQNRDCRFCITFRDEESPFREKNYL